MLSGRLFSEEIWREEEVNETVSWYLVLASQLVRTDGRVLIEHRDELRALLALLLPLKCRDAYELACTTLEHLLLALSFIYQTNYEQRRAKLDLPFEEYLPIRVKLVRQT